MSTCDWPGGCDETDHPYAMWEIAGDKHDGYYCRRHLYEALKPYYEDVQRVRINDDRYCDDNGCYIEALRVVHLCKRARKSVSHPTAVVK